MTKAIKMLLDPKVSYSLLAILVAPVVAAAQPVDTTVTKVTVAAAKTVNLTNKADKYTNRANGVTVNGLKGDDRIINEEGHDVLGVTWDRLFANVMGSPRLPKEADPKLTQGIQACLAKRPNSRATWV